MMEKSLYRKPTKISFKESGSASHRRRSTADDNVVIEDLKLGECFSVALSNKGVVYTWGMNEKG